MPKYTPPLPPQLSAVHATGANSAPYASPVDMPEEPLEYQEYSHGGRFNMDDEDLYGESGGTSNKGKMVEKEKGDCVVQ
jgi:hypothetical protein